MYEMRKAKSARNLSRRGHNDNDDSEIDFETLVREEFKKLHREYRLMEDARHAIAGASGKLSKQGSLLERLRDEKEDLLADIKNATCKAYQAKDKASIRTILEALERYEKYKSDIQTCMLSIVEMESNVDRITQRLVEQRLKAQALYGQSMTVPEADRRQRILENRLYHVTTQFDTLVSQNKALKNEINMMLKLRGSFYRRMIAIKTLSSQIKQRMGEVVYEATAAYDQRDEWVNKINILRERNDKDSKQHCLEIKEFQRVLHHDSKIHEFLGVKNKDRDQIENALQRNERKIQVKIAELNALLAAYKRAFRAILKMSKSRDIESLVNTYLEEEQKNYAVFKFITDLNHESNSLQEDIAKTKGEIDTLSKKAKLKTKEQDEALASYDKDLEDKTAILEATLVQWKETEAFMNEISGLVDEAFNASGCSNAGIISLLGNQNGMRPHNLTMCMKSLEHRTTELTYEKATLEVRKLVELEGMPMPKKTQLWVQGLKPAPQGGPFKPQLHITGRIDAEQEDEDQDLKAWSERPIYYKEMMDVITQKMKSAIVPPSQSQFNSSTLLKESGVSISHLTNPSTVKADYLEHDPNAPKVTPEGVDSSGKPDGPLVPPPSSEMEKLIAGTGAAEELEIDGDEEEEENYDNNEQEMVEDEQEEAVDNEQEEEEEEEENEETEQS